MLADSCFKIGYIQKTHGLKGELTAMLDSNAPDDLEGLTTVFLGDGQVVVPYFISAMSLRGTKVFLKLEDVDTIEKAQTLVRKSLFLEKSVRPRKGKGEFYDDEIVGFSVVESTAGILGDVKEVTHAGPNRLLLVLHEGKEVLIPVQGPFITSLNKTKRIVSVTLPDGFLDI